MIRGLQIPKPLLLLGMAACTASCVSADRLGSPFPAQPAEAAGCDRLPDEDRAAMVMFEPDSDRWRICNADRAKTRFVPASTYKLPHLLIALETRAIPDVRERFAWDGRDRGVAAWNRDVDVAGAVSASTVWVFQALAERIGIAKEAAWVRRFDYGNGTVGSASGLKHFWLSGPLKISAVEQVGFLHRFVTGRLAVSETSRKGAMEAVRFGRTIDGDQVYGKTGAMLPIDDDGFLRADGGAGILPAGEERTGWFVGWIDRPRQRGGPVYFALNLDLSLPGAMGARTKAAYAVLAANGFPIPSQR